MLQPGWLPAGGCRIDMKAEQRKQAIANELVWLAAGATHRLRCCSRKR